MPAARLIVSRGPQAGLVVEITMGEFSLGRESTNHLELRDLAASRRHATIRGDGEAYLLTDLDSANGTRVNGAPVRESWLNDGDEVAIGDTVLRFTLTWEADLGPVTLLPGEIAGHETIRVPLERSRASDGSRAAIVLRELTDLCQSIAASRDSQTVEQAFLAAAVRITDAGRGMLLRAGDGSPDSFTCAAAHDGSGSGQRTTPFAVSRTVIDETCRNGSAVVVPNLAQHDWKSAESLRGVVCSLAAVPIGPPENLRGILYLDSAVENPNFHEEQVHVLRAASAIFLMAWDSAQRCESIERENLSLRAETQLRHSMVGDSPVMRALYQNLAKVAAASDTTVLVLGESGTGKEVAARAIHQNSSRAARPFAAVNCALLNDTLLESDLFGHERGAFTGAVTQKRGQLEMADGGTLFLDELGELPTAIQAKLLRVIQEREFQRLGGTQTLKVDLRVVAATNRNLEQAVRGGTFREDLYYRLKVVTILMPPLRDRMEDIPALVHYFVDRCSRRARRRVESVEPEAMRLLQRFSWPGNVRELENAIEQALVMGEGDVLQASHLPETLFECAPSPDQRDYYAQLNRAKERILRQALDDAGWNFTEAAAALGVNRTYLHRLTRNLGIS